MRTTAKHGPNGSGKPGPCERDCEKCARESEEYCTGVWRRRIEDARKLKSDAERFRAGEPFPASATASTGRDPARKEIVPGLWSVMVPGIVRGSAARIQLTTSDGTRAVDPFVTVEVCAVDGVSRTVELSLTEARALLAVAIEWPGLKREGR